LSHPNNATTRDRVLVVDDEPQVLIAVEDLLSDQYIVLKTDSPEVALKMVRSEPEIAVVLSDQRMPKMLGDELLSKLAASSSASRILVTGYADLTAVVRAVNEGKIFAYVTKPWNPEDLRLKVAKAAEHYRLNAELTHERQLLNRVLDGMEEGVVALDSSGSVLLFNRQAERILGISASEWNVASWRETCGAWETDERTPLSAERDPLRSAMGGEPVAEREIYLKNPRVPGAIVAVSGAVLRDDVGAPRGGIAVLRDITERRQLERQLIQAQKMEAIGLLAGGVAHDFNNMLAVITGYAELVLEGLTTDDSRRSDLLQLLAGARRAVGLTRQLLSFSRRQVIQPKVLDLNEIVANVQTMLSRLIGEHIELRASLAPDLWSVKVDAGQMEQVLLNLTVNARDAMPQGGRVLFETSNVSAGSADRRSDLREGDFVRLAVTDNGTGMDKETQARIFEPFFTTKEPGRGTGLGLATVHGIVQQSSGELRVKSELGKGTTFEVYLPRAQGQAVSIRPAPGRTPVAERSASILLVEDEDSVRQVTSRVLRNRGYVVYEARMPREALRLLADESLVVDLLLVDVVMPEMSGPDLAEQVAEKRPNVKVLFMSGYSGGAVASRVTTRNMLSLEKPFSAATLTEKVRQALSGDGEASA
jgi:PAS domain S-box-containing protein